MSKKIYIAGPMTGYKDFNRPAFKAYALKLSLDGNVVLNPAVLPDGLEQREYMDICCAMIRCADARHQAKYVSAIWQKIITAQLLN